MTEISLFSVMEINIDGINAQSIPACTRKGALMLQYLLLNYGKAVPSNVLYEALWPNDTSSNPESALKTLVSRLRSLLASFDPELKACISAQHGSYMWSSSSDVHLDIAEFEEVCRQINALTNADGKLKELIEMLLALYSGDLAVLRDESNFVVSRRAYYHDKFISTVKHAIELYKAQSCYAEIIGLCRSALSIDAFEDELNIALMDTLVKADRSSEALAQYRHMSDMHFSYLGMPPSEKMQSFYKQLTKADQSLGMDIDAILRSLEGSAPRSGAFVCEYAIFHDVYQLQMRNLQRLGTSMYLAIIMLAPAGQKQVEPFELDKAMHKLQTIMVSCLRKGDTITRYSPSQFALLLPSVNSVTGRMVIKRIRTAYLSEQINPALAFTYKLAPVNPGGNNK